MKKADYKMYKELLAQAQDVWDALVNAQAEVDDLRMEWYSLYKKLCECECELKKSQLGG